MCSFMPKSTAHSGPPLDFYAVISKSVLEIRHFLNYELGKLDPHDTLAQNLLAMRAACRKFLDQMAALERRQAFLVGSIANMGAYGGWVFCSALGELRGAFGLHIAQVAVRNGLDVEDDLASVLPYYEH